MTVDPSLIAILVALCVGIALAAGGLAASLVIEATKGGADTEPQ